MTLSEVLIHSLNFMAPAAWLALVMPLVARTLFKKTRVTPVLWAQVAINFVAGMAALGFSLWFFGRDGKMAGYAGMALACATSQWLMQRR